MLGLDTYLTAMRPPRLNPYAFLEGMVLEALPGGETHRLFFMTDGLDVKNGYPNFLSLLPRRDHSLCLWSLF